LLSAREKFLALVLTAPLARADAIVALCGEDGLERALVAQELLIQGAADTIVLTGGLDSDSKQSAKTLADKLIGNGVNPQRIIVENEATNTRDQAQEVVEIAIEKNWKRLLLVASPYHLPRAALTFIHDVRRLDIRIIPVTANQVAWFGKPEGVSRNRMALLDGEYAKIAAYQEIGHVASYEDGIKHMKRWEGK